MPSYKQDSYITDQFAQLQKQLAWYKSFFEYAADAVLIVQPETWSILDANEYASHLLGLPKSDLLGAVFPEFRKIFKLLQQSGASTTLSEITLASSDGNTVIVEANVRFIEYDGQQLIQAIARDVAKQRASSDRMVQTDKMVLLGQLSAGVAHEIRNPLAAIKLNMQMLQRKIKPAAVEYNYLQTALNGVERIVKIVETTLDFSRQSVPEMKLEDINAAVHASIEFAAPTFARKTITIETMYEEKLPQVMADKKQLQQVFINLLTNAADAIRSKGQITIKTYIENDTTQQDVQHVVASISDSGIGISEEDINHIFDPFFTRKAEGTGLGLPISRKIIRQHHGDITVGNSPNGGAIFFVKLPILRN